jgi:Transposase DDE domain
MSQYKVRNWQQYNKSLENRGNIFFWIAQDTIKKWKPKREPHFIGAPQQYSTDAILCMMAIKVVFHLPYRQLIGFFIGLMRMIGLSLRIPHFTTVAYRLRQLGRHLGKLSVKRPTDLVFDSSGFKVYGEGEWKIRQHGKQKRRRWKKFHIAICPKSQEIIVAEATELEKTDCEVFPRLIKKSPQSVKNAIGDGAFDTMNCYKSAYDQGINLLTLPRQGAVHHEDEPWIKSRNNAISEIIGLGADDEGRKLWKKLRGYHKRSLVETTFSRFKGIFGSRLFSKTFDNQSVELNLKASILNRMTQMGMPHGRVV